MTVTVEQNDARQLEATFGELLRQLRRQAGLTQSQFADHIGYSRAQIASIEGGRRAPPLHTLRAISAALGAFATPEQMAQLKSLALGATQARTDGESRRSHGARLGARLGTPPNTLFGRANDVQATLAEINGIGGEPQRMVTLVGPGGVGKTRLAYELANRLLADFEVAFIKLDAVEDPRRLLGAVATALGVTSRSPGVEPLIDWLNRRRALLIIDNCEHLLAACTDLIDTLLARCPQLRVLATSREPLGTAIERVYLLRPLPPDDAYQMFVERARQAGAGPQPDGRLDAHIADICSLLGRMPLAIEIAAAQLPGLTIQQLSAKLHERFLLEMPGRRGSPDRHASLRKLIDWSYSGLNAAEARMLRQLSAFAGSASLAAIEALEGAADAAGGAADATVTLLSLIAKSLVFVVGDGDSRRYALLDTVRAYAADQLSANGEAFETHIALLTHYAALARRLETARGTRGLHSEYVRGLAAEWDNIHSVLDWFRRLPLARRERHEPAVWAFLSDLFWFWYGRGLWHEGIEMLNALVLLSPSAPDATRGVAYVELGDFFAVTGQYEAARGAVERGLALLGDSSSDRVALGTILLSWLVDDYKVATRMLEDLLTQRDRQRSPWEYSLLLLSLGLRAMREHDLAQAKNSLLQALDIARSHTVARGNLYSVLIWLGEVAIRQNDDANARALIQEARQLEAERRSNDMLPVELWLRGVLAVRARDAEEIHSVVREAAALNQSNSEGARIELALLFAANVCVWRGDFSTAGQLYRCSVIAQGRQSVYSTPALVRYDEVIAPLENLPMDAPGVSIEAALDIALTLL